jgi:hypothetical protein
MDEGQLFFVGSLEKVDQLIERLRRLRQEKSLHHDDVVKSLEKPLVLERLGMGLDS